MEWTQRNANKFPPKTKTTASEFFWFSRMLYPVGWRILYSTGHECIHLNVIGTLKVSNGSSLQDPV
jgi:hypothetical protein